MCAGGLGPPGSVYLPTSRGGLSLGLGVVNSRYALLITNYISLPFGPTVELLLSLRVADALSMRVAQA